MRAFKEIDFDVEFDEKTADESYTAACKRLAGLNSSDKNKLRLALMRVSKQEVDRFMDALRNCLDRFISQIVIMPLFGTRYEFESIDDALTKLNTVDIEGASGMSANISVGAKHDRSQYGIITNNLYAVMLRPLHSLRCTRYRSPER